MRTDSSPGTLPAREHLPAGDAGTPVLDVVIPVYNEEKDLQPCVLRLHDHLKRTFPYAFRITIADNASTDTTPLVAARLEAEIAEVSNFRLEQKGRGRALRTVWSASDAPILAYMDVDLSTDLNALLPLVAPLISGHSDLAIGSRLARSSRVVRGPKREFVSRAYNLILRGSLQARFSDAQCGFKAVRRDVARELLPHVFERFARGDSARSRATGSTGLGLAIVQAVAAAHGGAVTVDSVPGRTVFTVHLPALAPAVPRPAPEADWQSHSQAQHSATTWVRQGA
jgi:glycosyltransferase involved in cell wall biosynthesis